MTPLISWLNGQVRDIAAVYAARAYTIILRLRQCDRYV